MKKAILIFVFGLLLSGNAYADEPRIWLKNENTIHIAHKTHFIDWLTDVERVAIAHCNSHGKYMFWVQTTRGGAPINKHYKAKIKSSYKGSWVTEIFCSKERLSYAPNDSFVPGAKIFKTNYNTFVLNSDKKKETEPGDTKPEPSPDDNKVVAASSGSGFFVTRTGHLVTNYHVVEECDAVKVSFNAKEIQADTIAIDKFNDLAIIKSNINPSKVFPVSKEDVSLLQDVIVAGFPLGKKISALIKTHKGSVTALAGIGDNFSNFQTDATINHGNSGGPILTQKGNVIGVAVQLIPPDKAQNIFFGVKSSTLITFAKANKINFLPPNTREMSNEDLGELITEATVFLECWMTVAKIKQMIAQEGNRKAFYSEHK